ncbi:uncharacterized protein LOC118241296 [Electrophorus electricus]|uniref:uncharacterized protein LOC118241296 n=1 Tax=Electrophorus electricus TaxID=8005 RepID=UPI0015CFAB07|nr:uncharacterized protein LOC118241296 [Electrophorus electricus]
MVCISVLFLLFYGIDLLPLTLGSPDTLILVAEPGDDVTIWYQREKTTATYVYWFKHTDSSVPFYVGCQFYSIFSPPSLCYFGNQSKRMVMSVNSQNTSLTITAVNHTDTGLYYCGIMQSIHISFSNETYLQVKAHCSSDVFFMLTVVFGVVNVVLSSVLLVLLTRRKHHRATGSNVKHDKEEQDPNSVTYAALQFSDQNTRRVAGHGEVVDTHVVFSSVRH